MINLHNSKIIETPSEMICVRQFSVVDGGIFVYIYVQPCSEKGFNGGIERCASEVSKNSKELQNWCKWKNIIF